MNISFNLSNTKISINSNFRGETIVDFNTDYEDIEEVLNAIYDEVDIKCILQSLDKDQKQEIAEAYHKEFSRCCDVHINDNGTCSRCGEQS